MGHPAILRKMHVNLTNSTQEHIMNIRLRQPCSPPRRNSCPTSPRPPPLDMGCIARFCTLPAGLRLAWGPSLEIASTLVGAGLRPARLSAGPTQPIPAGHGVHRSDSIHAAAKHAPSVGRAALKPTPYTFGPHPAGSPLGMGSFARFLPVRRSAA